MKRYFKYAVVILALGLSSAAFFIFSRKENLESLYSGDMIRAVVDFGGFTRENEKMFAPGYDYFILKTMASDFGVPIEISFGKPGESWIDSLRQGSVDIVALPKDSAPFRSDSVRVAETVDDFSVWLVQHNTNVGEVNDWIRSYNGSELSDSVRVRFLDPFEPFWAVKDSLKRSRLSPYDELIRQYAGNLGWDWLLLASVIFQESRFRIEARSAKGAEGLMQMIPATSSRYDIDNMFDPEQNIKAGTAHLKRLQNMFSAYARDKVELRKMALAAYNAGEGHIIDCINLARVRQQEYETWESLCDILPEFQNEEISQVDTVKCGPFKSGETMNYVRRIYDIYWAFQLIYEPTPPSPSGQGQSLK